MLAGEEVATFERSDALYPADVVAEGGIASQLPRAARRLQNVTFRMLSWRPN
jgi:hypothetical protein